MDSGMSDDIFVHLGLEPAEQVGGVVQEEPPFWIGLVSAICANLASGLVFGGIGSLSSPSPGVAPPVDMGASTKTCWSCANGTEICESAAGKTFDTTHGFYGPYPS